MCRLIHRPHHILHWHCRRSQRGDHTTLRHRYLRADLSHYSRLQTEHRLDLRDIRLECLHNDFARSWQRGD